MPANRVAQLRMGWLTECNRGQARSYSFAFAADRRLAGQPTLGISGREVDALVVSGSRVRPPPASLLKVGLWGRAAVSTPIAEAPLLKRSAVLARRGAYRLLEPIAEVACAGESTFQGDFTQRFARGT